MNAVRHSLPRGKTSCKEPNIALQILDEARRRSEFSLSLILISIFVLQKRKSHCSVLGSVSQAEFTLKVSETSDGCRFRLKFTVQYCSSGSPQTNSSVGGGERGQEEFFTDAFKVTSNKRKDIIGKLAQLSRSCIQTGEKKESYYILSFVGKKGALF